MKRTKSKKVRDFEAELDRITPALLSRSGGRCEVRINMVCRGRAWTRHHRLPRGQGGSNDLSNLLHVCGDGTTGCHGYIEHNRTASYEAGWLVHMGMDPAQVEWGPWHRPIL